MQQINQGKCHVCAGCGTVHREKCPFCQGKGFYRVIEEVDEREMDGRIVEVDEDLI